MPLPPILKSANHNSYAEAAAIFQRGGCAVLPTETVYGLAARADDDAACERLYSVKGRSFDKPLPICVMSAEQADEIAYVSPLASQLIDRFWPGPLTLILPLKNGVSLSRHVTAHNGTVALRLPDCAWVSGLLAQGWSEPLALTSANPSGAPSPITAKQATLIGEQVDMIIDGGRCGIGAPSSLVEITEKGSRLLREGALPRAAFDRFDMTWVDA